MAAFKLHESETTYVQLYMYIKTVRVMNISISCQELFSKHCFLINEGVYLFWSSKHFACLLEIGCVHPAYWQLVQVQDTLFEKLVMFMSLK